MSTGIGSASGISFSGLGSGIDTASIVDALMQFERQPITRIQQEKAKVQSKNSVVTEMDSLVKKLRDAARDIYSPTALQGKKATAADENIASASVTDAAAPGTYNIKVTSLAASHTMATAAGPTLTDGASLEVTVGGEMKSVGIETGDTLESFAERLNSTEGMGASASVINNRLVLISKTGGTAGEITLGGTAAAGLGLATTQPAADAAAEVNGVEVTGDSNVIEGAINGVSLSLSNLGSTTITVAADTDAIQGQAQKFVDAYNAFMSNVNNATRYDAATKTAGTLQGDSMFTSFAGSLRNAAGTTVGGLPEEFNSLAQIGITSSRTGELTLDPSKFKEALAKDPGALRKVFGADDGDANSVAGDGIGRRIAALADDFSSNAISSRLQGVNSNVQRMDERIARLEDAMVIREKRLRAQFSAMETAVSQLRAQGQNLSSYAATL